MSGSMVKDLLIIRDEIMRKNSLLLAKEDDLYSKVVEIERKVDSLHTGLAAKSPEKKPDTYSSLSTVAPVKDKRKAKIVDFVIQTKKITASEMSMLINMSRTRCCEYLKELEREGVVKSRLDDKKVYYSLA